MATASVDLTLKYVAAGIGIALRHMSAAVARAQPGLHVRVFSAEADAIPVAIVVKKGAYLPKLAQEFRDTVRRHFGTVSDDS